MNAFVRRYEEKIVGVPDCFDRIIFKGHRPISRPERVESFLRRQKVLIKDFRQLVFLISPPEVARYTQKRVSGSKRGYGEGRYGQSGPVSAQPRSSPPGVATRGWIR